MDLDKIIEKAKEFVDKTDYKDDLCSKSDIGLDDTHESIETILSMINAVKKVQGTSKIYLGNGLQNKEDAKQRIDSLSDSLKTVYSAIGSSEENLLTRSEVVRLLQDKKQNEDDYYNFIGILSSLDLITSAGKGRTGGIKLYDIGKEQNEIKKIEEKIQKSKDKDNAKDKHEVVLYDSASKVISSEGYQAISFGVNRRLPGEWNTPDVIGYRINKHKVLGGAELEIVTVEVKWEMSKLAIAETNSHQKISHKSYLMVHQTYNDIDKLYIEELIEKGIGLICRTENAHEIVIPPKDNTPVKGRVDDFLDIALDNDDIQAIKKELAKHYYYDFYKPLLPN